jgi:hypothetical protein
MGAITQAFYTRLVGDATIQGLVGTYGGSYCIFTTHPVPEDAPYPLILTAGHVADDAWDTKETPGRELLRDIHAYTAVTGSATTVEAMGERIRALFHRQLLTVAGFSSVLTLASGPIQHDGEDFYGRVVTVRLVLQSA